MIPPDLLDQIVQGDCLEVMRRLPDSSVDAVVTDPPYNIDVAEWDRIPDYLRWLDQRLTEAWRVLKPAGTMWVFCSQVWQAHIDLLLQRRGRVLNRVVWCYDNGQRQARRQFSMGYDPAFWVAKGKEWTFDLDAMRDGVVWKGERRKRHPNGHVTITKPHPLGRRPLDVWHIPRMTGSNANGHPSPKPVPLIERCVLACTEPGDVVFDPFSGSGTLAVACINTGRRFICIEKESRYCEIVRQRVVVALAAREAAMAQQTLLI